MNPESERRTIGEEFPTLLRDELKIHDMDAIVEEITPVFQRCCLTESTASDKEREEDEILMGSVLEVDIALSDPGFEIGTERVSAVGADKYKALLLLFRKRISTPEILEALLRTIDMDIRTGVVRCRALRVLSRLTHTCPRHGERR
jgi:hypothetical protein